MTKNNGMDNTVNIIPPSPPMAVNLIAFLPCPSRTILWPGNMDNAVASSGTPTNMDGMNSMSAWVMDIESRKTAKDSGEKNLKIKDVAAKVKAPMVLTWTPGMIPVMTPHKIPKRQVRMRSKISITLCLN